MHIFAPMVVPKSLSSTCDVVLMCSQHCGLTLRLARVLPRLPLYIDHKHVTEGARTGGRSVSEVWRRSCLGQTTRESELDLDLTSSKQR
jgi:hypothetical protein